MGGGGGVSPLFSTMVTVSWLSCSTGRARVEGQTCERQKQIARMDSCTHRARSSCEQSAVETQRGAGVHMPSPPHPFCHKYHPEHSAHQHSHTPSHKQDHLRSADDTPRASAHLKHVQASAHHTGRARQRVLRAAEASHLPTLALW
jgi:hypothetical protein